MSNKRLVDALLPLLVPPSLQATSPEHLEPLGKKGEKALFQGEIARLLQDTLQEISVRDAEFVLFCSAETLMEVLRLALVTTVLETSQRIQDRNDFKELLPKLSPVARTVLFPFFTRLAENITGGQYRRLELLTEVDRMSAIIDILGDGTQEHPWKVEMMNTARSVMAEGIMRALHSYEEAKTPIR